MMIPDSKIDEIRERINIVDVISRHVALKKSGRNYVGLCPFHSEKTPSFSVNEEKQIFHCFGCGTGGNVFVFLMKQESLSFPEAAKSLAKTAGVDIATDKATSKEDSLREAMFAANSAAAAFYNQILLTSSEGENALAYLKKRGLTPEIIKGFKLGYSSSGANSLVKSLVRSKTPLNAAEAAGLLNKSGSTYSDRFRGRVMFPITDYLGRVIGFGGRTMGDAEPKYLNSPTTPLFKKGEVLYGMYQAKGPISKHGFAIIVEGYMDLIMLHQYGFTNAVATLGTALTTAHLSRLKGYAREVYTLFDSDTAGKAAALKSIPMFIAEDIPARIVLIPPGMDPDDLLRKHGPDAMAQHIRDAAPVTDFFIESIKGKYNLENTRDKVTFLEEAAGHLRGIKNIAERGIYSEKTAGMINVSVDTVMAAIRATSQPPVKQAGLAAHEQKNNGGLKLMDSAPLPRTEETIVRILIAYPELCGESVKKALEVFRSDILKEAGILVINAIEEGRGRIDISSILDSVSDERLKAWFAKTAVEEDESIKDDTKRILEDCCKKLVDTNKSKKERSLLVNQLRDAEKTGDWERFRETAKSYSEKKKNL